MTWTDEIRLQTVFGRPRICTKFGSPASTRTAPRLVRRSNIPILILWNHWAITLRYYTYLGILKLAVIWQYYGILQDSTASAASSKISISGQTHGIWDRKYHRRTLLRKSFIGLHGRGCLLGPLQRRPILGFLRKNAFAQDKCTGYPYYLKPVL